MLVAILRPLIEFFLLVCEIAVLPNFTSEGYQSRLSERSSVINDSIYAYQLIRGLEAWIALMVGGQM